MPDKVRKFDNGDVLEFYEDDHIYLLNGVLVNSVSHILDSTIYKGYYDNVPQHVLKNASNFGTNVHEAIENDTDAGLEPLEAQKYYEYKQIEHDNVIIPINKEQMVRYVGDDVRYVGTYDLEALVLGDMSLIDYKTTYNLDIDKISWQLSLYAYARGKKFDKFYTVWLPKRKQGELVEIPQKSEAEVLGLLEMYRKEMLDDE